MLSLINKRLLMAINRTIDDRNLIESERKGVDRNITRYTKIKMSRYLEDEIMDNSAKLLMKF